MKRFEKSMWDNQHPTPSLQLELLVKKLCKYVKREGESCTLNNNCTYPNCKHK